MCGGMFIHGVFVSPSYSQLFKANRPDLTFWFSHFGPYLVMAPKGESFSSRSFGELSIRSRVEHEG